MMRNFREYKELAATHRAAPLCPRVTPVALLVVVANTKDSVK